MKHMRFEEAESSLVDEQYVGGDRKADAGRGGGGIAKHFAETLEYDERKKWYHQLPQEPTATKTLTEEQIAELKKEAGSALHGDTLAYENKANKSGSSDQQWARTLMNKGAIGDRVAAATILIQDSPLHNLSALRNLINSVKPAKKKDGIVVIDALSELFVSELLIPDVKLRRFEQHPLAHVDEMTSGNRHARKTVLSMWYYEEQLQELYDSYVQALNTFAHDSVDANKEKAVSAMSYLLMHHPEKEKILLKNIINKIGDPSQAVASKVTYHLCQLLYNHPNMKSVVLTEIEKMLFRTNISTRAQYYGVCFLNQFYLGKDDGNIAVSLINIYFSFFKASIKKGEIDSRLMSAILTGVKRAYPFADKSRLLEASRHTDAVHRIVQLSKFNVAVHALSLLFHISDVSNSSADRYYTALYRKLTNAELFSTSHSALLFSLLYKSLKNDKDIPRVASFVKRLLQMSCCMIPAQACGILFLLSQVVKDKDKRDVIKLVWTEDEVKDEKEEEKGSTLDKSGNKYEEKNRVSVEETKTEEELKEEDEKKAESTRVDLLKGNKLDLLDDDFEESYQDLRLDEDGNVKPKRKKQSSVTPGWFHLGINAQPKVEEEKEEKSKIQLKRTVNMDRVISKYDPHARNPTFAGGDRAVLVELAPLANHFHPTVKLFAQKLIQGQIIQYSGDPLKDFSGVRFLDRFAFKNPKRRSELEQGASGGAGEGEVKKVKGSHPKFALRKNYTAKGLKSLPVNSVSYLNEEAAKIPVDERFLYDYLQKRRAATESDAESDSDADSVTSEDFEQYLDKVTGAKADDEADADAENLDFLSDVQTTLRKRGDKKGKQEEEEEVSADEDLEGSDDGSDGDLDISGDEDGETALSGEEDELLLEGSDDEDDDDVIDVPGAKSTKMKLKAVKGNKDDLSSLFASAEEFSTLLEDNTSKKQGSSHAVSNTDNANQKQLAWEDKRDHWIKGYNKKVHGYKTKNFGNKSKDFGNKNKDFGNKNKDFGNKNKDFGKKNRDVGNRNKHFGNKKRDFGNDDNKGRNSFDKTKRFSNKKRNFGNSNRDSGDKGGFGKGKSFEKGGKRRNDSGGPGGKKMKR